jgi:hypothetical protein
LRYSANSSASENGLCRFLKNMEKGCNGVAN